MTSNDRDYTRRNVVIEDDHQAFLEQTRINFSAFVRQSLDQYIEHQQRNGFTIEPATLDANKSSEVSTE